MTLLEICEPIFQYVCRLNRMTRSATATDYSVVRAEVKALLEDVQQKAASDVRLNAQMKRMELPLIFFVDSMIAESKLRFAQQWHQSRLAYERNELAGDEKFFDLLEETLKDNSDDASERLGVFYTCMGLGFAGMYVGQPEYLRRTMMTIAPRIRHLTETDNTARISGEAYENVDTRNLVQPPSSKMVFVVILFVICTVSVITSYVVMFKQASSTFSSSLDTIIEKGKAAGASAPKK
jgi:type IV/VI secretion system ImpK/VasF family protein